MSHVFELISSFHRYLLIKERTAYIDGGLWQYWGKIRNFFFVLAVRNFIMVARCSKCDFRNLGIIWDRNR